MMLKEECDKMLEAELFNGEAIKWSGQPVRIWPHIWTALPSLVFGFFFLSFSSSFFLAMFGYLQIKIDGLPGKFEWNRFIGVLPFVIIGAYSVISSIANMLRARRTAYAVTDRRVMIVSKLISKTVLSLDIDRLGGFRETTGGDGFGSVFF